MSLTNEFPDWGNAGELPPDGFYYEAGDKVNEKHLDALWHNIQTHFDDAFDQINTNETNLSNHESDTSNPHSVEHAQLSDVTSDDHHSRYTNSEARNAVDGSTLSNLNLSETLSLPPAEYVEDGVFLPNYVAGSEDMVLGHMYNDFAYADERYSVTMDPNSNERSLFNGVIGNSVTFEAGESITIDHAPNDIPNYVGVAVGMQSQWSSSGIKDYTIEVRRNDDGVWEEVVSVQNGERSPVHQIDNWPRFDATRITFDEGHNDDGSTTVSNINLWESHSSRMTGMSVHADGDTMYGDLEFSEGTVYIDGEETATQTWVDANYNNYTFSESHNDLTNVSSDDHHTRYADSEARSAVEGDVDAADLIGSSGTDGQVLHTDGTLTYWSDIEGMEEHGNEWHTEDFATTNELFSGSHDDLSNVSSNDHHTRYSDGEAVSAVESEKYLSSGNALPSPGLGFAPLGNDMHVPRGWQNNFLYRADENGFNVTANPSPSSGSVSTLFVPGGTVEWDKEDLPIEIIIDSMPTQLYSFILNIAHSSRREPEEVTLEIEENGEWVDYGTESDGRPFTFDSFYTNDADRVKFTLSGDNGQSDPVTLDMIAGYEQSVTFEGVFASQEHPNTFHQRTLADSNSFTEHLAIQRDDSPIDLSQGNNENLYLTWENSSSYGQGSRWQFSPDGEIQRNDGVKVNGGLEVVNSNRHSYNGITSTSSNNGHLMLDSNGGNLYLNWEDNGDIYIGGANGDVDLADGSGNVGIGTRSPSYKLDIPDGRANVDDYLNIPVHSSEPSNAETGDIAIIDGELKYYT